MNPIRKLSTRKTRKNTSIEPKMPMAVRIVHQLVVVRTEHSDYRYKWTKAHKESE
jgi:hypothetical protein